MTGADIPPGAPTEGVQATGSATERVPGSPAAGAECGRIGPVMTSDDASEARTPGELTEREREILAFEREWFKHPGSKERVVRERFDVSATRYYQILGALIDSPEALAYDPMLVKRLQRMREARKRRRAAQRLGVRE